MKPITTCWPMPSLSLNNHPQPVFCCFITHHVAKGSGITLWPLGISCPSCVPSQLLVHPLPTHWQGGTKQKTCPRHCSSTTRTLRCYKNHPNLNQNHFTATDPRRKTTLSKLKTGQDRHEDFFNTLLFLSILINNFIEISPFL